ncbi:MAG: dTDP-4-dehydrorhamnose 3,5-epimerase [Paenibacillus sp.]|nr:dTDP-4-dehydrorhamnose 3,5-epimerase [Paenibacillus sp.]
MRLIESKINGAVILEPEVYGDHRGYFMESYNLNRMQGLGLSYDFIQDNQSLSVMPGVIRGLHYQLNPKAQTKLVRVLTGVIYDVIVDIRSQSPTYGQWAGFLLSEFNKRQLLVPPGMAHGFCTLTPNTQVLYKVDQYYSAEHDRGLLWNDPDLGIEWPVSSPILSDKDKIQPRLKELATDF